VLQVEISKGYGVPEWREDLKRCLLNAGLKARPTTFLFSDVQIVDQTQLEDLNSILNSGDVPGMVFNYLQLYLKQCDAY
jgi:dynein heavy chain, axonemal